MLLVDIIIKYMTDFKYFVALCVDYVLYWFFPIAIRIEIGCLRGHYIEIEKPFINIHLIYFPQYLVSC